MIGEPCKNPDCAFYGKPHPNYSCYGFADGGEVSIDPSEVVSDNESDTKSEPTIDPSEVVPDNQVGNNTEIDQKNNSNEYSTPGQQALAGIEGLAKGIAGPLATETEIVGTGLGIPGIAPEDIAAREKANPITSAAGQAAGLIGSVATGIGEAPLVAGIAKAAIPIGESAIAKMGSTALGNMIASGVLRAGDKFGQGLLGQGDPEETVGSYLADIGGAGLIGGGLGALSGAGSSLLSEAANAKLGTGFRNFLQGVGFTGKEIPEEIKDAAGTAAFKYGQKMQKALTAAGSAVGGYEGYKHGGPIGAMEGATFGGISLNKYTIPAVLRILGSGDADSYVGKQYNSLINKNVYDALDYANTAGSGLQKINGAVNNIFQAGAPKIEDNTKAGKKLKDYIESGNFNQEIKDATQEIPMEEPLYAEGGEVSMPTAQPENGVARFLPEHNIMLNAAKSRIVNYLSNLQPQKNNPKLAFDDEQTDPEKEKNYNKAINIANHPLNILSHVKNGTIDPDQISHLNAMHPEIGNILQKKITEKITDQQLKGEKPPYHIRQGLSLLLGTPLSGEMLPQNIQAAQMSFQNQNIQQSQQQPVTKNKKNTSTLTKSDNQYLTGNQARIKESQRTN